MSEKLVIEVDAKGALARHIEDLQRVITKRNQEIEFLKTQVEELRTNGATSKDLDKAYRKGVNDALSTLAGQTQRVQEELNNLRRRALNLHSFDVFPGVN